VITGDVAHHPCQIAHPDWTSASDFDPDQARSSRRNLWERFADTNTLIIGSHYADPVAGRIRREGTRFRLAPAEE
jgi:glyoxylase-like metal-dependent hydrolase (beta-lactamase superfamily II)